MNLILTYTDIVDSNCNTKWLMCSTNWQSSDELIHVPSLTGLRWLFILIFYISYNFYIHYQICFKLYQYDHDDIIMLMLMVEFQNLSSNRRLTPINGFYTWTFKSFRDSVSIDKILNLVARILIRSGWTLMNLHRVQHHPIPHASTTAIVRSSWNGVWVSPGGRSLALTAYGIPA